MAAILNGFLPARSKERFAEDKILNLRWGDSTIASPIPSAWNASHRHLPPTVPRTPPQEDTKDGIFVVEDSDCEVYAQDEQIIEVPSRHTEVQPYISSVSGTKLPKNLDLKTSTLAASNRSENRYLSPVDREVVDPILAFRERLAVPSAASTLSPVQENFAKDGPSHRQPLRLQPVHSPLVGLPPTPRMMDIPRSAEGLLDGPGSNYGLTMQHHRQGSGEYSAGGRFPASSLRSSSQSTRDSSVGRTRNFSANRRRDPSADASGRRATSMEPRGRRGGSAAPSNRTFASSRDSSVASVFEKGSRAAVTSQGAMEQQDISASHQSTPSSSCSGDGSRFSWESDHQISNNSSTKTTPEMDQSPHNKSQSPDDSPQWTRSEPRDRPVRPTIRTSSKSRGLYADMADDFRHLARDVRGLKVVSSPMHEHHPVNYPSPLELNPPNSFRPTIDTVVSNTPTSAATITPTMSSQHLQRLDITSSQPNPALYPLPPSAEPSADVPDDVAEASRDQNLLEALARHHREEAARFAALAKESKRASKKGFTMSVLLPSAKRKQSLSGASGSTSAVSTDSPIPTQEIHVSSKAGLVPDAEDVWGW